MPVLDIYQKVAEQTRQMLEAARTHNWDELLACGTSRDELLASLPDRLPPLSATESARLQMLIKEVLTSHAEIIAHAQPWLKHTAKFLLALDRANSVSTEHLSDQLPQP